MNITIHGLEWAAFWIFLAVFVWLNHVQYLAGHANYVFEHRTPHEIRLREAAVVRAEQAAKLGLK
jgi:hypothetical protein